MDTLVKLVKPAAARVAAGNERVSNSQTALERAIREARGYWTSPRATGQLAGLSDEQARLPLRRQP